MRIGEAIAQFKSEFYLGNICSAIWNFFQNIKGSFGDQKMSSEMGSARSFDKTTGLSGAQVAESFHLEGSSTSRSDFESSNQVAWCDAHNNEVKSLKSQADGMMEAFFRGPGSNYGQPQDLESMTLEDARQFLGIGDGEETRLDASERGGILGRALDQISLNDGQSFDKSAQINYMRQKIQKAVELVQGSGFKSIPEPEIRA
jgi:hypothetical protein